jgi:hypothetical protein
MRDGIHVSEFGSSAESERSAPRVRHGSTRRLLPLADTFPLLVGGWCGRVEDGTCHCVIGLMQFFCSKYDVAGSKEPESRHNADLRVMQTLIVATMYGEIVTSLPGLTCCVTDACEAASEKLHQPFDHRFAAPATLLAFPDNDEGGCRDRGSQAGCDRAYQRNRIRHDSPTKQHMPDGG